jgi:acyl-homoserine lactone acylase PvdQ
VEAYNRQQDLDPKLRGPIDVLRKWDFRTSEASVAMTLSHFYGTLYGQMGKYPEGLNDMERMQYLGSESEDTERLSVFSDVVDSLTSDFGTWELPWGEVNRYQRINGDIRQAFDDSKPSIPIGFASGRWGALAAYGARYHNNTKRIYGTRGNSFVAVVEFGEKVKAKSILAGGQSGDPQSPHFDDQATRYANAEFKEVPYYEADVRARAQEEYRPGERNK